jgi:tubulin polyglutamylase complex subunit 2
MTTTREVFDNISMNVIQFLENHICISDVEFVERQGCSESSIHKWEEDNQTKLPDDFKAFLQISDGLQLTWKIKKNEQTMNLGAMNLNRLREIKRIHGEKFHFSTLGEFDESDSDSEEIDEDIFAFEIDSKIKSGRLALIYMDRDSQSKPQIWFQDLSCNWFFIANTFTDYFRLMIVHLGIPLWQYAFTNTGLDQQTLQWFRFLSPERLAIDIENRRNQLALARKKGGRASSAPNVNRLL